MIRKNKAMKYCLAFTLVISMHFTLLTMEKEPLTDPISHNNGLATLNQKEENPPFQPYWLQYNGDLGQEQSAVIAYALLQEFEAMNELLTNVNSVNVLIDLINMQYDIAFFIAAHISFDVCGWECFLFESRDIDLAGTTSELKFKRVKEEGIRQVWVKFQPKFRRLYQGFLKKTAKLEHQEFVKEQKRFLSRLWRLALMTMKDDLNKNRSKMTLRSKKLLSYVDFIYNFVSDVSHVAPYNDLTGSANVRFFSFLSNNFKSLYNLAFIVTLKEGIHWHLFIRYYRDKQKRIA